MTQPVNPVTYAPTHNFGNHAKTEWGVMRPQDYAAFNLLVGLDATLDQLRSANESAAPLLLSLRPIFRGVRGDCPRTGLRTWLADHGADRPASPVAIWLLGKTSAPTTTKRIGELLAAPMSLASAKHLARALARLRSWRALDQLCAQYPQEEAITRYARARRARPFTDRLRRFSTNVDQSRAPAVSPHSRMPLWLSAGFWRRRPPRSPGAIRALLDHIHRLVHGA